jgi:hypothetical protein
MKKFFNLVLMVLILVFLSACGNKELPIGNLQLMEVRLVNSIEEGMYLSDKLDNQFLSLFDDLSVSRMSSISFETTINSKEWIAIYINQPVDATEKFDIEVVVINMPDGKQDTWTALSVLDNRKMEIRMDMQYDRNIIFIPIIVSSNPGEYPYSIEQIRYKDFNGNFFRVNKGENLDAIAVLVSYPELYNSNSNIESGYITSWNIGIYDQQSRSFNFLYLENIINRKIYNIVINNTLVFEYPNGLLIEENTSFTIPESFEILTTDWLKISFSYDRGFGSVGVYTGYVVKLSSNPGIIPVYSGFEFGLVDRNATESILLKNDIIIDFEFEPFTSNHLNILAWGYVINYTFSNIFVLYDNTNTNNNINNETYINLDGGSDYDMFSNNIEIHIISNRSNTFLHMVIKDQEKIVISENIIITE